MKNQKQKFESIAAQAAVILLSAATLSCAHQAPPSTSSGGRTTSDRLSQAVTEYAEAVKRRDAFSAPYFNVEEDLDQFGDYGSAEYFSRARAIVRRGLERLKDVDEGQLPSGERKLYRMFKQDLETQDEGFSFPEELLAFNQMENRLHSYLDDSSHELTSFPFDSVKHYEAFIKRAEGFPAYVDRQIELFKRGLREGVVLSCDVAKRVPNSYKDGLESNPEKNPFFRPAKFMPQSFSAVDRARLTAGLRRMVAEKIIPGFVKLNSFYKQKYLPRCRKGYGIVSLPRGKAWYAHAIRAQTDVSKSAKEIHALGLAEVARIEAEIDQIQNQIGFKGDRRSFLKSLTGNPDYFFKSAAEMVDRLNAVRAAVNGKIPTYFNLLPKTDYRIVETSNPEDAAGQYNNPTENVPYGRFIVNAKNLRSIPIFDVTSLSLHETVPGHHFQLALQYEMKDRLSEYERKIYNSTSFVEGWALYSEYLGNEMGLYQDPLQRLGNRNDEMLRAVRLVVDTGIHDLGWTRAKAVDYMTAHLALDAGDISNEANRYASWPGQALSYKIGQLKIIELRRLAEKELGAKFDLREFHRAVIGQGTVSLGALESQVRDWIAARKGA